MSDDARREPVKVIGDILKSELGLGDGTIMLTNQRWGIPQTQGMFIALGYISGKAIANNNYAEDAGAGMNEVQEVVMHHLIQIDAMSFNEEARVRLPEIIQALRSIAAESAMAENTLQLARMPGDFTNVSTLEETGMLNRFTMTIAVTSLHRKTKALPAFYDTFDPAEVKVNE